MLKSVYCWTIESAQIRPRPGPVNLSLGLRPWSVMAWDLPPFTLGFGRTKATHFCKKVEHVLLKTLTGPEEGFR